MKNMNILVGCLIVYNVIVPAFSATHSVDWSLGNDYTSLATGKPFAVGDTIVFNYGGGHTVDEVSESDYKGCTLGNSISSDSSGTTSIALKTSGPHYFICSVPGHCAGGMKLSVIVAAGASSDGGGDGSSSKIPPVEGGKTTPVGGGKVASSATAVLVKPLVVTYGVALLYVLALYN